MDILRKNITCPTCKAQLNVTNPEGVTSVTITCPKCKTSLKVKFYSEQQTVSNATIQVPADNNISDQATIVVNDLHNNNYHTKILAANNNPIFITDEKLMDNSQTNNDNSDNSTLHDVSENNHLTYRSEIGSLQFNNICYQLKEGVNTIGRKSSNSDATIQLPVDDNFMSRHQATIVVTDLYNGSYHTTIQTFGPNPIIINGIELTSDEKYVLCDGDSIMLGYTTVTFILKKDKETAFCNRLHK